MYKNNLPVEKSGCLTGVKQTKRTLE